MRKHILYEYIRDSGFLNLICIHALTNDTIEHIHDKWTSFFWFNLLKFYSMISCNCRKNNTNIDLFLCPGFLLENIDISIKCLFKKGFFFVFNPQFQLKFQDYYVCIKGTFLRIMTDQCIVYNSQMKSRIRTFYDLKCSNCLPKWIFFFSCV